MLIKGAILENLTAHMANLFPCAPHKQAHAHTHTHLFALIAFVNNHKLRMLTGKHKSHHLEGQMCK